MSFQIYENTSLQVINSGSVIMDPAGLFVASNWSGSTNIHPLSSSDDIYKSNGPIGENYYCDCSDAGNADFIFYTAGIGAPGNGFTTDNTGNTAGLTYSFWMKSLDTSDHWLGGLMKGTENFLSYYGPGYGWIGGGGWIANDTGLEFPYDNDWHHYMQTWDSGSKDHYWYIDGKVEFYNDDVTPINSNKFLGIGGINALIDEFAFFHKGLTPLDVAPYGKPINPMKKKDEFKLKLYWKCGDGSEQGSGSNVHSLVNGGGYYNTGSLTYIPTLIGSASANLLKNSGRVIYFNG